MSTDMTNPQPIYLHDYCVPDYLIEEVDLEFQLDEEFTVVKSSLHIQRNPASVQPTSDLVLSGGSFLELQSIALNNQLLSSSQFAIKENQLTIFSVPQNFTLDIETRIKPQENTSLSGLYQSSGNFCTQCEAQGFRNISYFLDRPDVMARYTTHIIADEKRYPILLSNGNRVAAGKLANGKHWVRWQDPFKKPSYLFALVAGDFDQITDSFITQSGRQIVLQIYVEKGQQDKCAHAMQAVKKAMRWDEEKYGREYDLDIYMIVAVSDFNMGAMENKGLNIFNTKYILATPATATDLDFIHIESVIAHEYFHNWTGNRITCRDWFQLSLKEGLTIFRDQSFTADTTSPTVTRIQNVNALRMSQFPEDAGPLAHSVRPDSYIEINNFYTTTIYNKGAEVIGMIKTIVGDALFRRGMDLYFERHDGQAVTIEDFVKAHEDAAGVNLEQFRLWYSQAGTPSVTVTDQYDAATQIYTLRVVQTCAPTPGQAEKKPMHIPFSMGLLTQEGKEILSDLLHIKERENQFIFHAIPSKPVPSLLRSFSAPVKIHYSYSNSDLILLFQHDPNLFNRWEAGQKYMVNLILQLAQDYRQSKPLILSADLITVFQHQLTTLQHDKWLLSEMLTLPAEKYLAEQMTVVDIEAIHVAREFVLLEVATRLKYQWIDLYHQLHQMQPSHQFKINEVGNRYLKNLCLIYLMALADINLQEKIGYQQFSQALTTNMTDTMGALRALIHTESKQCDQALAEFYQHWQEDALVVDKWFALQAGSKRVDTLMQVKKLLDHPAFDLKNPNKVYALIGTFGHNLIRFHAENGEGYEFLAQIVLQLDALNPQVAARMVKPLTEWQRYDVPRQKLMRHQLNKLVKSPQLSPDVFELVTKSL